MSAESVVYYLKRPPAHDPVDETEWLFSALGQFTGAELRELLYIAQEPDFFETMRAVFALPEPSRLAPHWLAGGKKFADPVVPDRLDMPGHRLGRAGRGIRNILADFPAIQPA